MQYHWLNRQNNNKIIIFFFFFCFDYKPFEFLNCKDFDVLFIYDYSEVDRIDNIDFIQNNTGISDKYEKKFLITWSMGVFAAFLLKTSLPEFEKKIAVNGTPFPVNDNFGIPQKPFLLTLRHAKTSLEGKFYQNIFDNKEEFERYSKNQVSRTIENRVEELKALYNKIKTTEIQYNEFYDFALISRNDLIIPTKNQINFWKDNAPYKLLDCGHFPFYNFTGWDEIINYAN